MEPMNKIDRLAEEARAERSPRVDVTQSVMSRIRQRREDRDIFPLKLGWFAVASAAAAGVAAFLTFQAWSALFDPLGSFFNPLFLMIQ